ncbi:FliM/FliN family flagellar motor switch protein [Cupriavidus sp. 8B]
MKKAMEHFLQSAMNEKEHDTVDASTVPMAQVLALSDLHTPSDNDTVRPTLVDISSPQENPLHRVKARLTVCVGAASLTVGELLAAKEQQVLRLDRKIEQPVDLVLEGRVVARGQLVAVDEHFAVRITELPVALKV